MRVNIKMGFLFLVGIIIQSCNKDSFQYGEAFLYMPQATVSGGTNNHYLVPSGAGVYTNNYVIREGKLQVILGVNCSGSFEGEGYTVELKADREETGNVANDATILNSVPLPENSYTLPGVISVQNGNLGSTVYLSIDVDLFDEPQFEGKNLILVVGLHNPTKYDLSNDKKVIKTTVIINVDQIKAKLQSERTN